MRIPRIYTNQALVENTTVILSSSSSHHIANVLRMKCGHPVTLFNGLGGEYRAVLSAVSKKGVSVDIAEYISSTVESPLNIELGICLIKNDRMDWLLQKATELGVTTISPLFSEYTDVKLPSARQEKKMQHWQQVLINACEQSGRVCIPRLHPPHRLQAWVESVSADKKIMLHPGTAQQTLQKSSEDIKLNSIALLVGPEGGFTENEVDLGVENDFATLTLGPRILRAETAPLVMIALLQCHYGDYKVL